MLVEADGLTRYYGNFLAVDHVSFQVGRGEIVGLLGPNGAGKTTTIRMLTGFLPATQGTAAIAGCDIRHDLTDLHRHIGYMPENNPLYPEMRAREYLSFRAHLKGVPRKLRDHRIAECADLCSLGDVLGQVIGTLSKGYRQRVGLADAMLGRPDVLILDEPTIGLDPNQVRDVRRLIQNLSEEHTVLISTHILAEAEAICRRVLIIDRGRIVADDSPGALSDALHRGMVTAELKGDSDRIAAALGELEGVESVRLLETDGWHRFRVASSGQEDLREGIYRTAVENGWPLRELTRSRASLEDVFHRITLGAEGSEPLREDEDRSE